jgi:hypothetical protein
MPEFLNYYGKLFEKSKIMERIMPRSVNSQTLKEHFPHLLPPYQVRGFEEADCSAVNTVREQACYNL